MLSEVVRKSSGDEANFGKMQLAFGTRIPEYKPNEIRNKTWRRTFFECERFGDVVSKATRSLKGVTPGVLAITPVAAAVNKRATRRNVTV